MMGLGGSFLGKNKAAPTAQRPAAAGQQQPLKPGQQQPLKPGQAGPQVSETNKIESTYVDILCSLQLEQLGKLGLSHPKVMAKKIVTKSPKHSKVVTKSPTIITSLLRGEKFQTAQPTHDSFLALDHSCKKFFLMSAKLNFHGADNN